MDRVKVLSYHEDWQAHRCLFSDGKETYVDLLVSGDLPYENPDDLIGKDFEFDWKSTFIFIAHRVSEVKD